MARAATTLTGWKTLVCALGIAAAAAAAAKAATPVVACQPRQFEGVPVCAVNMTDYATYPGSRRQICPGNIKSTGPGKICEQTLAAAMSDAKLFFKTPGNAAISYLVFIDAGLYDFSAQTQPLPHLGGSIDPTGIVPGGTGCLLPGAATTGVVTLSGSGCLIISGVGASQTTLLSRDGIPGISGTNVSHLLVENMTMAQTNLTATQGTYASQGTVTIRDQVFPTLTMDFPADLPSPLDLFRFNCAANQPAGCGVAGYATLTNTIYLRAYTNASQPSLVPSVSDQDNNSQYPWGYPSQSGGILRAVAPIQPDPVNFPNRWTLTMSSRQNTRAIPSFYSGTTGGVPNLLCMKIDHAQAFYFNDLATGGSDIIMNNMVWAGAGRGVFRGVNGQPGGSLGAQVYNSQIQRPTGNGGTVPCLSTQSGGLQIGQPNDPPVYGAAVYNFSAQATGDDTIAVFNDVGGTPAPGGGLYPQTTIAQSQVGNSFGHDIVLHNNPAYTGLPGLSPVLVDSATQDFINLDGNCDTLVEGPGNCPVSYVTP